MKAGIRRVLLAAAFCSALCSCARAESEPVTASPPTPIPQVQQPAEPTFTLDETVHPYTGLEKGEDYPEGKRGVAFMISNVQTALPQSGINTADLLYEMVTEGGITRLMAVYRDYENLPVVGPIRSARDQHVQLAIPLECVYAHIGGSTYALDMLEQFKYPGYLSIDGKYKNFYWIDTGRRKTLPQENCVFTNGITFADALERYGLDTQQEPEPVFNFVSYKEPLRVLEGGSADEIVIRFSGYEDSRLVYDPAQKRYYKYEFGEPQVDTADNGRTYGADNVFVLFTQIDKYNDRVLARVSMENGAGLYLCNGRYERVRWMKGTGERALRIVDAEGHETDITVNPGQSYSAFVGLDQLEYCRVDGLSIEELLERDDKAG